MTKSKTHESALISVIVPVYNVAPVLERCIISIQNQTYQNLEIILVDDGSTDRSGELCDKFAEQDSRIKVYHQKNAGLSAARNTGLKHATGKYVTFVDSDDLITTKMIAILHDTIVDTQSQIASCTFKEVFPDGKTRDFVTPSSAIKTLTPSECLAEMLSEHGLTVSACGKLYERQLFQNIKFPEGKLYEDVGTTYQLVMKCRQIAYLPQPLYYYYQNSSSIIHQSFSPQKLDLITLTDQMCDAIVKSYPELTNLTRKRRMHARFSILRQIATTPHKELTPDTIAVKKSLISYLKQHRSDILQNPSSDRRDRFAMMSLLAGFPVFRLSWKLYISLK